MIETLLTLVIYILIIGVIFWLIDYVIQMVPLPAPFAQVVRVILAVVAVIIVILLLLRLVGGAGIHLTALAYLIG
jgi:hypothetical protein